MTALKLHPGTKGLTPMPGVSDTDLDNWAKSKSPTIRRLVAEVQRLAMAQEPVTVCSQCFRASCWADENHCAGYQFAGTVDLPIVALEAMALEDPEWWV